MEKALLADAHSMSSSTAALLAQLDRLYESALVTVRAYRKKITIPAAHLRGKKKKREKRAKRLNSNHQRFVCSRSASRSTWHTCRRCARAGSAPPATGTRIPPRWSSLVSR